MAVRSEDLYLNEGNIRPARAGRRLSRRQIDARRRFVASIVVVVVAAFLFLLATGPAGNVQASRSDAPRAVNLQPGQTLWDLAERYAAPGQDPRAYVDSLIRVNSLDGLPQIGERIRLPR